MALRFEERARQVAGAPDAIRKRSTVIVASGLQDERRETYVLEMVGVEDGVYCFLEVIDQEGQAHRLALPPRVVTAILRQREAITAVRRRRAGQASAEKARQAGAIPFARKAAQ